MSLRISKWRSLEFLSCFLASLTSLWIGSRSSAQILPDSTLGAENSTVTPDLNINGIASDRIDGGAIRGANLFHSFQEFNIPEARGAYFSNPDGIANILTRVTGRNPSYILGTLGVLGNANLFLINPNGLVFGPNARLDVRGSFLASSADSLLFDSGFEFSSANPEAPPLLAVNIPIGLRFRETAGSIINQSRAANSSGSLVGLSTDAGKTLGLIGGAIALESGYLSAPSGRIELGSVAPNNRILLATTENGFTLGYAGVENFQDIQLNRQAAADASGVGGGSIQVVGRQLSVKDGSQLISITRGTQPGGNLTVRATAGVEVSGTSADGLVPSIISSQTQGAGRAGNLTVETGQLIVRNGIISAASFAGGGGGDMNVRASEGIELSAGTTDGLPRGLVNAAFATGDGGNLTVETKRLILREGGSILTGTRSAGNSGRAIARASESVEVTGTSPDGALPSRIQTAATDGPEPVRQRFGPSLVTGNAGNLTVETGRLLVQDGASISTATEGSGAGGSLTIRASESVEVRGASANGQFVSRLQSDTKGGGAGGNLTIETGRLQVSGRAFVSASAYSTGAGGALTVRASDSVELAGTGYSFFQGINLKAVTATLQISDLESGLFTATNGAGAAGNIAVETGKLIIRDGAQIAASTFNAGAGGDVTLRAAESVEAIASGISTITTIGSTGEGGKLTIDTGRLIFRDGTHVSVAALGERAGDGISIRASESVEIFSSPPDALLLTGMASNSIFGRGKAGDIVIDTKRLILRDGGQIITSSGGVIGSKIPSGGPGGNLTVNASESVEVSGVASGFQQVFDSALGTSTFSAAPAGSLTISTGKLIVRDGGGIFSSTEDAGRGGTLNIRASESVEVSGTAAIGPFRRSGLFATSGSNIFGAEATGAGGNLTVRTGKLIVRNGGIVSVSSIGLGEAGTLEVLADSLRLDAGGIINASTVSGAGGSIVLQAPQVQLRRGSSIATNAGNADGGNITIRSDTLAALENSDITANARAGRGGRVSIAARGIFGTEFRQQQTPKSDITATSELGASFSGTVQISTPDVDPTSGLVALPQTVVDVTALVGQDPCRQGLESEFSITGKGGLPPNPDDPLSPAAVMVEWATREEKSDELGVRSEELKQPTLTSPSSSTDSTEYGGAWRHAPLQTPLSAIVPARGWAFNDKGEVVLTDRETSGTGNAREWRSPPTCGIN